MNGKERKSKRLSFFNRKKKTAAPSGAIQLAKSAGSLAGCADVLRGMSSVTAFAQCIEQNLAQIKRFEKKRETIEGLLLQKFSADEISYIKFNNVLAGVEKVVYINLRSIINKIAAFDDEEYRQLENLEWNDDALAQEKMAIYKTYIAFADEATRDNEEILLKLDRLLLEISQFSLEQEQDIMSMPAIAELDKLINDAKRYR